MMLITQLYVVPPERCVCLNPGPTLALVLPSLCVTLTVIVLRQLCAFSFFLLLSIFIVSTSSTACSFILFILAVITLRYRFSLRYYIDYSTQYLQVLPKYDDIESQLDKIIIVTSSWLFILLYH